MSNDLIKAAPAAPTILDMDPEQVVEQATRIARSLALLVQRGGMVQKIKGQDYVKVEGWNAMGSLMGFVVIVTDVQELPDGGFDAFVDIRSKSGAVLSSATSRCGMDEGYWKTQPAFARRSMAITRATGKAYRIGFSWVMALAELSVTPAEEMPQFEVTKTRSVDAVVEDRPPHPAEPFRVKKMDGTKGAFDGRWPGRN